MYLTNCCFVCQCPDHELAADGLLHDLEPGIPEQLGELLGAVDDRVVHNLDSVNRKKGHQC